MDEEYGVETGEEQAPVNPEATGPRQIDQTEKDLAKKITDRIHEDEKYFKTAFERMKRDMAVARRGAPDDWPADSYTANITGRHINQKTSALYAKNPKAIARRSEKLDFVLWDENTESLMMALQTVDMAMQAQAVGMDPMGMVQMDPAVMQAQALVQDYQQGMQRRQMIDRIGKTLEILFGYYTREQNPVDFKTSMKQLVRRTCTCGVGYIRLGFQREYESNPQITQRLADFQSQLRRIQRLAEETQDPQADTKDENEVKVRELELSMASLQEQQYVLVREGLTFDFPESTSVIPDRMTRHLVGFIGSRWLTLKHLYTVDEVKENFGVDLEKGQYRRYSPRGANVDDSDQFRLDLDDEKADNADLVCVWEHFDRAAGTVYILCDGYEGFLREPGAPDVYVETFWPVEALTFNEVEDPEEVIPPSDVTLMLDMQREYNRARQGLREHRIAARPRFLSRKGALDDESKAALQNAQPWTVTDVNPMDGTDDVAKLVRAIEVPGVDPNLYETGQIFSDIELTVGASEAAFGATAKATATESSIAESSRAAAVDSNVDDLDSFLTRVARASGQILLRELSEEEVKRIAGPGAVWPQMTLDEIVQELYLEIEAGSSGKPNQAQEIRNWTEMLPFLLQMQNITPTWLARETLRRLDDKMDLTEAITEGVPAMVALNRMAGSAPAPAPGAAPEDQGGAGADNAPVPGGPAGTDAPMGNNQQAVM